MSNITEKYHVEMSILWRFLQDGDEDDDAEYDDEDEEVGVRVVTTRKRRLQKK